MLRSVIIVTLILPQQYCKAHYFGGQIANIKGAKIPKFQPLEISLNCPETSSIRLTICSRNASHWQLGGSAVNSTAPQLTQLCISCFGEDQSRPLIGAMESE
jgi:hypothetical protein